MANRITADWERRLAGLNVAQRVAVEHVDGPQLILAGPGSGKTRVVTYRIANLLAHGIPSRQILALTFTNKAAAEMQARVALLAPESRVWISTFHRFCARLLREHAALVGLEPNYTIFDTSDSQRLLKEVLAALQIDTTHYAPERIVQAISGAKNQLVTPEQYAERRGSAIGGVVARVYPEYQQRLLAANAVDFDDLLVHVALMLRDQEELRQQLGDRYRYILVDEYQDTNHAQYEIVRALGARHRNLSVTGDPDQSIYGWRGANIRNILDFEHDFPGAQVVRLEQNYRSTKRILRLADALIANNQQRKHKTLFTENDEGAPVRLTTYPTHMEEAEEIVTQIAAAIQSGRRRPRDFAIFYRMNALSRSLEIAFRRHGVPFQLVNSVEFFQRQEIKDVMAYLHLINNPRNDVALLRVLNTPPRGIGKTTVTRLTEHARARALPLLEAAREAGLVAGLAKRAAVAVAKFVSLFDRMCEHAGASVEELLSVVLAEVGYVEHLREQDDARDEERLANVQDLISAARQFDAEHPQDGGLERFLEQTSLVNDTDSIDGERDCVSVMTIHSAKGLEFPVAYLVAVEHGILPHERSREDVQQEQEERRLMFVAMTRAREELHLSMARYRDFRGRQTMSVPSQFLMELPRDELEIHDIGWTPRYAGQTALAAAESFDDHDAGDLDGDDGTFSDDDLSFDPEQFSAREQEFAAPEQADSPDATATSAGGMLPAALRLTTGAELAAGTAAAPVVADERGDRIAPEAVTVGMLVRHPEYGLGKIAAVSGTGARRVATVQFVTGAGQRTFILGSAPLRSVESGRGDDLPR